jgi:uncharacterized protein
MLDTMIVIAKSPIPGRVKTRLCPPLTYDEAAVLADAAIADTLDVTGRVAARQHLLVLDGPQWPGNRSEWEVVAQVSGGLDERLVAAFTAGGTGSALLVGMDTPQLLERQLTKFDPDQFDACIGLAHDGGYWAIGFRDPLTHSDVIRGVPMSMSYTGAAQLAAMQSRGLRVQVLDQLTDVDTYDDACAVAELDPETQFATCFRSLSLQQVG